MIQLKIIQAAINKSISIATMISAFFIMHPVYAQAQNLDPAKKALDAFKAQLIGIIPVAAAVILLCLAIGYAGRYIEKDTFVRWAIGVVIAGSAAEIATLLFTGNA
ncbi:VirB2 family type IV secretion system major pilin TrwL [Bartonella machadoae]|uniref:VirB2 family type IV secretion system major pilin TrwL n=1 Tax=Bartonella machadoae TaxID=2893471 RepID=UPI001F4D14A9|nr:VirB2 family type IV secretion system major pilin TrwL [Bartonella machadoae]UNE54081.1 VirB2 family type IV secretion system major pilin TrwL [Bartonella machadoae]